jgi:hypothetical protein
MHRKALYDISFSEDIVIIDRDKYLNQMILKKCHGMIKMINEIKRCGKLHVLYELGYLLDTIA